jgi:hypothetical protein
MDHGHTLNFREITVLFNEEGAAFARMNCLNEKWRICRKSLLIHVRTDASGAHPDALVSSFPAA